MRLDEFKKAWQSLEPGETLVYFVAPKGESLSTMRDRREEVAAVGYLAREYGTPTDGFIYESAGVQPRHGFGLGHLTQRRLSDGRTEYRITKASMA